MEKNIFLHYHSTVIMFFLVFLTVANAQPNAINKPDFKSVDNYVSENYFSKINPGYTTILHTADYLTILLSSRDCENCALFLNNVLVNLKSYIAPKPLMIYVVTDNVAYAKKVLAKYELNFNYFYDEDIFSKFDINSRTVLYIKANDVIVDNIQQIIKKINTTIKESTIVFEVKDSIMGYDKIVTSPLPYNNFISLDPKMDTAILYHKEKDESLSKSFKTAYLTPKIKDSLKLYNLPERPLGGDKFKKATFGQFVRVAKANPFQFVKLLSITSYGNLVYCTFMMNRAYEDPVVRDNYRLTGDSYIAVKEIKKEKDLNDIMNIDAYDQYYLAHTFNFEGEDYAVSTWINYTLTILDKNTITTNVKRVINNGTDLEFASRGTIVLNPSHQNAKMISLDKKFPDFGFKTNVVKLDNYDYSFKKEMTDKANNAGIIKITRIPVN